MFRKFSSNLVFCRKEDQSSFSVESSLKEYSIIFYSVCIPHKRIKITAVKEAVPTNMQYVKTFSTFAQELFLDLFSIVWFVANHICLSYY